MLSSSARVVPRCDAVRLISSFTVLKRIDTRVYDVVVVSPRNHFLFTPLLASTAVGTLEFRTVIEQCRERFSKKAFELSYDKLVIATGATSNTFGMKGVDEHCLFMKQVSDAQRVRRRLIECFERASSPQLEDVERRRLLSFVVVGGGPTSIELAGEIYDWLRDAARYYPALVPLVRVTLVEAGNAILPSFTRQLANYAARLMKRRRIDVKTGVQVTAVRDGAVSLSTGDDLPFGLCVWSAGIGPTELSRALDLPKSDDDWRLAVDDRLRVRGHPDIYAIGDIAACGVATAQFAVAEAKHVVNELNGGKTGKFTYTAALKLAYVGGEKALVDGGSRFSLRGIAGLLVWRSAYITRLVSWGNKILVPAYFFKSFVFGRDMSILEDEFAQYPPPPKK